jgi:hypothetical protein
MGLMRRGDLRRLWEEMHLESFKLERNLSTHHFSLSNSDAQSKTVQPNSQLSKESMHVQLYFSALESRAIRVIVVDNFQLHPKRVVAPVGRNRADQMDRMMTR